MNGTGDRQANRPWSVGLGFIFRPVAVTDKRHSEGIFLALVFLFLCAALGCGTDDTSNQGWQVDDQADASEQADTQNKSDAGSADTSFIEPDGAADDVRESAPRAVGIETRLGTSVLQAGDVLDVTCVIIDENGEEIFFDEAETPETSFFLTPADSFQRDSSRNWVAVRAGEATITCSAPGLGFIDLTPETVRIEPGPVQTVFTTLERHQTVAGVPVGVQCEAFDAYGNVVETAQPTVMLDRSGDGFTIEGFNLTITVAGIHQASCQVDGAPEVVGEALEVLPDLPASLSIAALPNQPVYAVNSVVTIATVVTDQYGNTIDNPSVTMTISPTAEDFGDGRFRLTQEGRYRVVAAIEPPTHLEMDLVAELELVVNSTGPSIQCISPANGEMRDVAPGSPVTFRGRVADANGIRSVTVNGQNVSVGGDGTFSVPVTTRFGINFVDIVARDEFDAENSSTCAFLTSDLWSPATNFFDGSIALRLAQSAFDDDNRQDGLDSFADILLTVLNSSGLTQTIDTALSSMSPLANTCLTRIFGACVLRVRIYYGPGQASLEGLNEVSTDLVSGGLRLDSTIRNLGLPVRIDSVCNTRGRVKLESLNIDLTSNMALRFGRPRVSLRAINSVSSGNVNLRGLSGLCGGIVNFVSSFFRGRIRGLIEDEVRGFIEGEFNAVIDGLLSNLDVNALGTSFNVATLDGNDTINVGFSTRFSDLDVSSQRALFSLSSRFSAPVVLANPTLGGAVPSGTIVRDPGGTQAIGASIHVGVFNQVLHTLWRAGLLNTTLRGGGSNALPPGTTVTIDAGLPPVLSNISAQNSAELMLGALQLTLSYPGLFEQPIRLELGARASTGVRLTQGTLRFERITINEIVFSTQDVSLSAQARNQLEDFLRSLVETLVLNSLNNSLPALPVPSFGIPPTVSQYGLPPGGQLGIKQPSLSQTLTHYILQGDFGIQ